MNVGIKPLVSVIVTIYNKEKYVSAALDSIINQSLKEIEIICVDDGSTDKSGMILDDYAQRDSRIIAIHTENKGQVSATKTGIFSANAEFIGFVDADDWIEPDMFKRLYCKMKAGNLDFISTGLIVHEKYTKFDSVEEKIYDTEAERRQLFSTLIWDYNTNNYGIVPNTYTKLYKNDILKKSCKDVDNRVHLHEDDCFVYSYILQCKSIEVLHEAYYHYRYVGDSDSNSVDEFFFARQNYFYLFLKKEFEKTPYYDILLPQLDFYFVKSLMYGINYMTGLGLDAQVNVDFIYAGKRKIIVYGAGRHGVKIIDRVLRSKNHELIGVVDKNLVTKEVRGYTIQSLDSIKNEEFDLIIIAIVDKLISKEVYNLMVQLGIPEEKIKIA